MIDPSASLYAYYGAMLRQRRQTAGLSQQELAARINYSAELIGNVETTYRKPTEPFSVATDGVLGGEPCLHSLWRLIQKAEAADWFRNYAELEAKATSICMYEPQVITGLLQTADYALAVSRAFEPEYTETQHERDLRNRLRRQRMLERDDPPYLWVIQDEASLRRPVGGGAVHRAALAKLLEMAERPRIVVQVLAFKAGEHANLNGPLALLTLPGKEEIAYIEARRAGRVVKDPDEVADCKRAFDRLRASALSESDSSRMIASILEEFRDDEDP